MFLSFKIFPFLSCLTLVIIVETSGQSKLLYQGEAKSKIEYGFISYMAVADSIFTLAQAQSNLEKGYFTVNTKPDLNLGIAKDNYWVTFSIVNTTPLPYDAYINLENPRLNEVEVFLLNNDSLLSTLTLGDNFPFHNREVHYTQFAFPVQLPANDTISIFLLIKHKGNTLQMPISMLTQSAFILKVESDYLFAGTVSGIFLITVCFGLFILFNTRDILFIYYSGYIFSAGLWLWTTEGFAFQYLWPNSPELATRLGPGVSALSACFFLANCLQFCRPYDTRSRFRKILIGVLLLLALWTTTPFLPFVTISEKTMAVYLSVFFTVNFISALLLLAYLGWLSRNHRIVFYYLSAVFVTIGCNVIAVLRGAGIIQFPFSTSVIMSTGYVLELVLMTAGITKQFYNYRKEKEEALLANVEQQKSITEKILQTQKAERSRISSELHDDIGPRLTQITLMSEAAKRQLPQGSNSAKELTEIAEASRGLVGNMGEIIWSLNPENMSLADLLSYLREQLHKLLEHAGMEYEINFDVEEIRALSHLQLRNILLVTKEIVHNSVKHSSGKKIDIHCSLISSTLIFTISDNGIGFELTESSSGNGLRNINQRIKELNGTVHIESKANQGTTFFYSIPL